MFGATERRVQRFANRFEPDGEEYLYRKRPTDAPVRVTAKECEDFIEEYRERVTIAHWLLILGGIFAYFAPRFLTTRIPGVTGPYVTVLVAGFFVLIFTAIILQAGDAPSIALRGRAAIDPGTLAD